MDSMADAVAAADSIYAVLAIGILGLYALLWRFGGELLKMMKRNTQVTEEAKDLADTVIEKIKTNHGSKNIGDAVDRLTEWMVRHFDEAQEDRAAVRSLEQAFVASMTERAQLLDRLAVRLEGFDKQHEDANRRLKLIENKLGIEDKE